MAIDDPASPLPAKEATDGDSPYVVRFRPGEIRPEDIDDDFVPKRRTAVEQVSLEGGMVLHDPIVDVAHHLNPQAAMLWELADGSGTAGEIIDDITGAYGANRAVVAQDVLAILSNLGSMSLLEGVWGTQLCPGCGYPFEWHHRDLQIQHQGRSAGPATSTTDEPEPVIMPVLASLCQDKVDALPWVDQFTIERHGVRLGVRVDDTDVGKALRDWYEPLLVGDTTAPPNFSLRLDPPTVGRGIEPFRVLYEGHVPLVRTRGARGPIEMLDRRIDAITGVGGTRLSMAAFVRDDATAVVVPSHYLSLWGQVENRLDRRGISIVGGPLTLSTDGQVVVAESAPRNRLMTDIVATRWPGRSDDRHLARPGLYRVVRWVLTTPSTHAEGTVMTEAEACSLLVGMLETTDPAAGSALGLGVDLLKAARWQRGAFEPQPGALVAEVLAAFD